MLDILKIIYQFENHAATTLEISLVRQKLGYPNEKSYNSLIVQNAKRVKEYLNKESLINKEGDEIFWGFFFDGEYLEGKNIINTEVRVGKSFDSGGWTLTRADLNDLINVNDYEGDYPIVVDGISTKGRLNVSTRLFYRGDELKNHLEKLFNEDPNQKIPIQIEYKDENKKGFEFKLKKELIEAIETLYDNLEVKYPHSLILLEDFDDDTTNSLDDFYDIEKDISFYDYLTQKGYLFDKKTIENYLLSLKVKPFAILTGNSGTGKTKLSQLFAQYLNLEDIEYVEEEIESPNDLQEDVESFEENNVDSSTDVKNNMENLEGEYFVEYSRSLKESFIKEGKFQISATYPFKEYYGKCDVDINGNRLEAKVSSENIIIFNNCPEIKDYLLNTYQNGQSNVNFKINSTDISKAIINDYNPNNGILEGEVTQTVFNRIKLPLKNGNFPGTTSDFYPIKYEVPCRVIVDNKIEGVCTLRSYAWIELVQKNSYQIQLLKNSENLHLKIYLDTFEYDQIQTTDFSTVGDYIDYKSFKKNLGLDLSVNKLDEELSNKIKNIFNFSDEDLDEEGFIEIKNLLNLTGYETEDELIKIFSDAMNKKKNSNSDDLHNEEEFEDNSSSINRMNENKNSEVKKVKKIINFTSSNSNYKIIPVGANWTENRHIVGYYNVITNEYQSTPAYDLIKQANNNQEPHFLILDEMNLSHVERYFADFLSAIESGEKIPLYGEEELTLPPNLFIVGTVNVDETTYMFSPKVLDRANVIEFETYSASDYMKGRINLNAPSGNISYLENPLAGNEIRSYGIDELRDLFGEVTVNGEPFWNLLTDEIYSFQKILKESGFDFGFRVINEIVRFMAVAWEYEGKPAEFQNWTRYFDACIKQKLLPKLHGSEKIIGETLDKLYAKSVGDHLTYETSKYPESARKLHEMREVLRKQRYVSFIN